MIVAFTSTIEPTPIGNRLRLSGNWRAESAPVLCSGKVRRFRSLARVADCEP